MVAQSLSERGVAVRYVELRDVCFGSETDISAFSADVRYAPENGHWTSSAAIFAQWCFMLKSSLHFVSHRQPRSPTMTTRHAACNCGQLHLTIEGEPSRISMCHCLECQRRTGAVISNQARFRREQVTIDG